MESVEFFQFHGIRPVPRNPSVEFFQFHGIRGNWLNLAANFHGMPWNFYITSGSTILPSFFMETTALTKKFRPNTPRQYSTEFHHDSMAYLQTGPAGHCVTVMQAVSAMSEITCRALCKGGRLLKLCRNLPAGHCVTVVKAALAMSEPTCRALCCRGADC